jgi:lipopolysaccharide assembly outer membrane protein LptD (OstA)
MDCFVSKAKRDLAMTILRLVVCQSLIILAFAGVLSAQEEPLVVTDSTLVSATPVDTLAVEKAGAPLDSLYYEADILDYLVEDETIVLTGNAKITYDTSTIKADSISINFNRNQAKASGRIIMDDVGQLILGSAAYYDIESQTGIVIDGASRFDMGYYYGQEIRKVGGEVYDVDHGSFTTCDANHPHFNFMASSMRVYRDHMVVGRPIIFYVNDFPVLALPYGAFSIKGGRTSGILTPEPGFNQGDGKYFRNIGYFLVLNDYADITMSMDLMEKKGYNYGFNLTYLDRYRYNGRLNTNYHYRFLNVPEAHRNDWFVNYRHFQNLPDRATFDVSLDFASSRQVWESEVDVNKRLQERITSRISWRKPFTTSSFYASGSYTEDLLNKNKDVVLPSFSYSMPSKPIHEFITAIPDSVRRQNHWWKNFSLSWSTT